MPGAGKSLHTVDLWNSRLRPYKIKFISQNRITFTLRPDPIHKAIDRVSMARQRLDAEVEGSSGYIAAERGLDHAQDTLRRTTPRTTSGMVALMEYGRREGLELETYDAIDRALRRML